MTSCDSEKFHSCETKKFRPIDEYLAQKEKSYTNEAMIDIAEDIKEKLLEDIKKYQNEMLGLCMRIGGLRGAIDIVDKVIKDIIERNSEISNGTGLKRDK